MTKIDGMNHRGIWWEYTRTMSLKKKKQQQHIIWVCLKRLYVAVYSVYPKKYHWSLGTLFQTNPFELIKWTIWVQEAMAWNPLDPNWLKSSFERTSYGYGSIPINTIFRGLFTSMNPSYFDVNYRGTIGFDTLPYINHILTTIINPL